MCLHVCFPLLTLGVCVCVCVSPPIVFHCVLFVSLLCPSASSVPPPISLPSPFTRFVPLAVNYLFMRRHWPSTGSLPVQRCSAVDTFTFFHFILFLFYIITIVRCVLCLLNVCLFHFLSLFQFVCQLSPALRFIRLTHSQHQTQQCQKRLLFLSTRKTLFFKASTDGQ